MGGQDIELQYHETLFRMAMIDGPTGIYNKSYFMEALEREIARASRYGTPLTLLMLDIDHFKTVNDCYGHLAGDYVLWELAELIKRRIRAEDIVARYGGEEFSMVLPQTKRDGGLALAENLRQTIEDYPFVFTTHRILVTSSIGLAQWQPSMNRMQLIEAADAKLYEAKWAGRNRVIA
ncbi:MAG: GGDEF domain-containing protein [Synechococcaceae cyanobacterium RM1_1_27]|nr:GGDEF domain-containing protein [Synechococcaceae cyanobacterium RM1_1_27]